MTTKNTGRRQTAPEPDTDSIDRLSENVAALTDAVQSLAGHLQWLANNLETLTGETRWQPQKQNP